MKLFNALRSLITDKIFVFLLFLYILMMSGGYVYVSKKMNEIQEQQLKASIEYFSNVVESKNLPVEYFNNSKTLYVKYTPKDKFKLKNPGILEIINEYGFEVKNLNNFIYYYKDLGDRVMFMKFPKFKKGSVYDYIKTSQHYFALIVLINLLTLILIYYKFSYHLNKELNKELDDIHNFYLEKISKFRLDNEDTLALLDLIDDFKKYVIYSKTDLFGVITEVSEAFEHISGYERKEIIGQTHKIIKHPHTSKNVYKEMWTILTNDDVWEGELKNRAKDGRVFWTRNIIKAIYDNEGIKKGYMSLREDITELKLREIAERKERLKYTGPDRRKKPRL